MDFDEAPYYDEVNRIWHGPKSSEELASDISIGQLIYQLIKDQEPNNILQVNDSDGISLTANEVLAISVKIAKNLQKFNLQQSDVVCVIAKNSTFVLPIVLGTLFNNFVLTTLNAEHALLEPFDSQFLLTRPKVIFCDGDILDNVQESINKTKLSPVIVTINKHRNGYKKIEDFFFSEYENKEFDDFEVPRLITNQDVPALIVWSSGTTGPSKGIALTHRQLLPKIKSARLQFPQVVFTFSSIYWISGISILLQCVTGGSKRIITENLFSPSLFFKLIEKYEITVIFSNPSILALASQCEDIEFRDLTSLRYYVCGGAQVPVSAAEKFQQKMLNGYFIVTYGMTEVAGEHTIAIGDLVPGKVGQIYDNVQMKIIDKDGNNLGVNEVGEVCFKTEGKWIGFIENFDASRQMCDDSGWIHSGDLGYFDENECLFIVDRIKDIIKFRCWQVSPNEIENIILQIDGVSEACVFGVDDPIDGDLPAVAVTKNIRGGYLTEKIIQNYVAERMPEAKRLHGGVFFVDNFPRTASGKIKRRIVKKLIETNIKSEQKMSSKL